MGGGIGVQSNGLGADADAKVDLNSNSVKTTIPVGNAPRKIVVQSGAVPVSGGAQAAAPPAQQAPAPQAPAPAAVAPQGEAAPVKTQVSLVAVKVPKVSPQGAIFSETR